MHSHRAIVFILVYTIFNCSTSLTLLNSTKGTQINVDDWCARENHEGGGSDETSDAKLYHYINPCYKASTEQVKYPVSNRGTPTDSKIGISQRRYVNTMIVCLVGITSITSRVIFFSAFD